MTSSETSFFSSLDRSSASQRSPESLELMGKQAAARFLREGTPLTDAVKDVISEEKDITQEQIKRVVEYANTSAYLGIHDRNKTAGANSSYPQFALADPGRVIQELSDGSKPLTVIPNDVDYGRAPPKQKTAGVNSQFESELDRLWPVTKQGSPDLEKTTINELLQTKTFLEEQEGLLTELSYSLEREKTATTNEYMVDVRDFLTNGGTLKDVAVAAMSAGITKEKVAEILNPLVVSLIKYKVATVTELKESFSGLDKVASSRVIDLEHPLVSKVAAIVALEDEADAVQLSLSEVASSKKELTQFLRDQVKESVNASSPTKAGWSL